jgi:hypothetical protein
MPRKSINPKIKVKTPMVESDSEIQIAESNLEIKEEPVIETEMITSEQEDTVKKTRMPNKWVIHCKEVRAQNEGMSYKESMILAKSTYIK